MKFYNDLKILCRVTRVYNVFELWCVSLVSLIMLMGMLYYVMGMEQAGVFELKLMGGLKLPKFLKALLLLYLAGEMTSTHFTLYSLDYSWRHVLSFICILAIYNYFLLIVYSSLLFPLLYLYLQLNLCINYINHFYVKYVNSQSCLRW